MGTGQQPDAGTDELRVLREVTRRAERILIQLGYLDPFGLVAAFSQEGTIVCGGVGMVTEAGSLEKSAMDQRLSDVKPQWRKLMASVLREAPGVKAVIIASPPKLMVHGSYGKLPRPVTHAESGFVRNHLTLVDGGGALDDSTEVEAVARALADGKACVLPGVAVVVGAGSIDDAMYLLHSLEHAAIANLAVAGVRGRGEPTEPTLGEIEAIDRDRHSGELVQRAARQSFFDYFNRSEGSTPPVPRLDLDDPRAMVAAACRVLASVPGLVEFKEHVSLRESSGNAFAMSPAKSFSAMLPEDIVSVAFDEQASWKMSSTAPTRFRFYHRDLFITDDMRHAIVHTHGVGVNAVMLVGQGVLPTTRLWLPTGPVPTVRPSMMFDEHDRTDALGRWNGSELLHIIAHGTDYFSADLRQATVDAMHHELAARWDIEGACLGDPKEFSAERVVWLRAHNPPAEIWWNHYAAQVDWSDWPGHGVNSSARR